MSSSEEPSRYIPPHRRQRQQCSTPQTTTIATPRRLFHQASPSLPASSTRRNDSTRRRRRPRDSSSLSRKAVVQPASPPRSSTLSPMAPVWTPAATSKQERPTNHHHHHQSITSTTSTTTTTHEDNVLQAESLFTRIVCINLIRRSDRWQTFQKRIRTALKNHHNHPFAAKVERFAAVDGQEVMHLYNNDNGDNDELLLPLLEWDATQNAQYDKHIQPPMTKQMTPGEVGCAMSHVRLWKELAEMETTTIHRENGGDTTKTTMLILEDDAILYQPKKTKNERRRWQSPGNHCNNNFRKGRHSDSFTLMNNNWRNNDNNISRSLDASSSLEDNNTHESMDTERIRRFSTDHDCGGFIPALLDVWMILPKDWDILYLGFSDRGERRYITSDTGDDNDDDRTATTLPVTLFRPTYGFHTHAYALTQKAAMVLLDNLPVQGPLDVWLADNQWFGLNVYCAFIEDGTSFKGKLGAQLISQQRHNSKSDIGMSGRVSL